MIRKGYGANFRKIQPAATGEFADCWKMAPFLFNPTILTAAHGETFLDFCGKNALIVSTWLLPPYFRHHYCHPTRRRMNIEQRHPDLHTSLGLTPALARALGTAANTLRSCLEPAPQ